MATSPWHHRRKPPQPPARRTRRLPRPCLACLARCAETLTTPAGHALLLGQADCDLLLLLTLHLLGLHLASHQTAHHL
ncbi:hypothetical protein [Streptomyces leeuwenhoekii]|uniref:Uncharacterized protein n=1 Tax=Streptomyces leeuwenhoekii TaxID=1437453 RepID=A0A0F7VYK0_STRLW|nr:hypothetical protein [Streptomyces leeuwenhoekii]CQR61881.1 Hypothetical Protein sle_24200 [Streptomyces leeuwenhoekii]